MSLCFILNLDTDEDFYSKPESCGGSIPLSYSSPNVTFSTPHYFQHNSTDLYINCWWHIITPYGEEAHLSVVDMETREEELSIYDSPSSTSTSYQVSHLYGRLASTASVLSSRGGLTMHHIDRSSLINNGRGYLYEAHILGEEPQS